MRAALILLVPSSLTGCGGSAGDAQLLTSARAWAAAQRAGRFERACDLSSTDSVAAVGGRLRCVRFFATYPFGRHVQIDPEGLRPARRGVFAITDTESRTTYYGKRVCVVKDRGADRVRFRRGTDVCP